GCSCRDGRVLGYGLHRSGPLPPCSHPLLRFRRATRDGSRVVPSYLGMTARPRGACRERVECPCSDGEIPSFRMRGGSSAATLVARADGEFPSLMPPQAPIK